MKHKYRLIGINDYSNPVTTILINRQIIEPDTYINLNDSCIHSYNLLENMSEAVSLVGKHLNDNVHIIVDSDVDGYTSAACVYKYFKDNFNITCTYSLHSGKQHGLSSEVSIPDSVKLVIIPDAGTNNTEQCKVLVHKGIDVLILDHHEQEIDNPYACIVNNQCCDYPNKDFCGVGIVYKFLQALDEEYWNEDADKYLDLVALGNISDCMDMRSYETKRLVDKGLSKIRNKLFLKIIEEQSYSINDDININNIQFYITPLLNALIRVGTQEEKELLFRAFIEDESETFSYKKRGESSPHNEDIYSRAVRFCKSAKAKQGRMVDKQLPDICERIESKGKQNNSLIVMNVTDIIDPVLTGVVAIKVAEKYSRPTLLLRKNGEVFSGSARCPNHCPIYNFKDVINSLNSFEFAQGHQGAFGVQIKGSNVNNAIEQFNKYVSDNRISLENCYLVDFEIEYTDFDIGLFQQIYECKQYYGNGIEEAYILIKNVPFLKDFIEVKGANQNTWSIACDNGIEIIKFKCPEDDEMINYNKNNGMLNLIGKCSMNIYNGVKKPQIIIEDYEVIT